jgi:phytoene dehydrogenase-like protein
MYDAIIIGAGMSGLAAGIRLAHFDKKVCILERHNTIGGLNSFYRLGGRNFDVGLHAVTNFTPKGARQGPLSRLLRQLRLRWDELALVPQRGSEVRFPGVSLEFNNDPRLLESQVRDKFPSEIDGFREVIAGLVDYDDAGAEASRRSAREAIGRLIRDRLLCEMLFCPLLFYGGWQQRDLDFTQFSILFRSIFQEGLARPLAGVRLILKTLVKKFKDLGGELRLRSGVQRITASGGAARTVVLDDGSELSARRILSSAGWHETMRLCGDAAGAVRPPVGELTFVESMSVLDSPPRRLGHDRTLVFFNDSDRFAYEKPAGLTDVRSGVVCSPNNFEYEEQAGEGLMRITALANYDRWAALGEDEYRLAKLHWYDRIVASAVRFVPDFRSSVIDTDMFTPLTIRRFTGHDKGAVYGSPEKRYDGTTPLANLFVCGTDQGLVGIVGSLISGITVANRHLLNN